MISFMVCFIVFVSNVSVLFSLKRNDTLDVLKQVCCSCDLDHKKIGAVKIILRNEWLYVKYFMYSMYHRTTLQNSDKWYNCVCNIVIIKHLLLLINLHFIATLHFIIKITNCNFQSCLSNYAISHSSQVICCLMIQWF